MMKKRFTSLMMLLMCCVLHAVAQKVASVATPFDELTDGYYLIIAKSESKNANGNQMYFDGGKVRIEANQKENNLIGSTIIDDNSKSYFWEVKKNGEGLQIRSFSANKWLNNYKNWGVAWDNIDKVNNDYVETGSSAQTFAAIKAGNEIQLSIKNGYKSFGNTMVTVYLTNTTATGSTDDGFVGYRHTPGKDILSFTFYKAEMPEPVSLTYNYQSVTDKQSIKQQVVSAYTYRPFPTVASADFVTTEADFKSYVTNEDANKTFNIACNVNLPFDTNKWYYLQGNNFILGVSSASDISTHKKDAPTSLNNVVNDIWTIQGNPFDGFKIYNVSKKKYIKYNSSIFSGKSITLNDEGSIWYVRDNSSILGALKGFALTQTLNADINSASDFLNLGDKISFGAANEMSTVSFTPATITLNLHSSQEDNATFATTCLPYAVKVAEGQEGIKTYAGKLNLEQTELEMKEVAIVPANQGIIISGPSSCNNVVLDIIDSNETIDNDLRGTIDEMPTEGILSFGRANGNGKVGFFRSTNNMLSANRAYIQLNDESIQSLAMNFGANGEITNISSATQNAQKPNAPIYDLSGRRVFNTSKGGIYIQQGRKFIAK